MNSSIAAMFVGVDVQGYKQRNAYIATQGPLPNTVNDLWRMLLEFKSKIVVTLCHLVEEGEEVCHQFWPSLENETVQFGGISVTLLATTNYVHFEVRKLQVQDEKVTLACGNLTMYNCSMQLLGDEVAPPLGNINTVTAT